jgi:hypothetical protein
VHTNRQGLKRMKETIVTVEDKLKQIKAGAEIHSDKGYEESTLEKQQEFAKKRNYPIPPAEKKFETTDSTSEKFFKNK